MNQTRVNTADDAFGKLAFVHYLRTGRRLPMIEPAPKPLEIKFNPYHDPRNGQFTFAPGGSGGAASWIRTGRTRIAPKSLPAPVRADSAALEAASPPIAGLDDGVYRPEAGQTLPQPAQYRPIPPGGMGGNIRAFQDPMTLEQVFPGLRDAPGGSILSLADSVFDLTAPADELTTSMSLEYSTKLIGEIKAIDPSYHFDSLGVPETLEGQMNQIKDLRMDRAVAAYRTQGETGPLQVETLRFLQERTDAAYEEGVRRYDAGKLNVRLSREEAIGNFVDRQVRDELRDLYYRNGVSTAAGTPVRVNSREYDTSGTDVTYRRPDARIASIAFDVTLTRKTLSTAQVRGFFSADFKPESVIIIRPSQLGPHSSYAIQRPGR